MRFSIIGAPRQRWDLDETAAESWWDWVKDALLADKLGFDAVYTGEHVLPVLRDEAAKVEAGRRAA